MQSGVEGWVLRGRNRRTWSGPRGSSHKASFLGAAGAPGRSRLAEASQVARFDLGGTTILNFLPELESLELELNLERLLNPHAQ